MSLTALKLQKSTVNEPNRRNKLEMALKSIVTKHWWFFGIQQNIEFGRFDNLPEVWKIFSNSQKRKNDTPLTQIIGRTRQTVAVGSWKVTSDECLSFSDHCDTKQNALRPKQGLLSRRLLIHRLKNLAHCMGLGGLNQIHQEIE